MPNSPSTASDKNLEYATGLFAAMRRGKALKGSQAFLRLSHTT
jgi:hypothetical protein